MTLSQSQLQGMDPSNLYAFRNHKLNEIRRRKREIESLSRDIEQITNTLHSQERHTKDEAKLLPVPGAC